MGWLPTRGSFHHKGPLDIPEKHPEFVETIILLAGFFLGLARVIMSPWESDLSVCVVVVRNVHHEAFVFMICAVEALVPTRTRRGASISLHSTEGVRYVISNVSLCFCCGTTGILKKAALGCMQSADDAQPRAKDTGQSGRVA